MQAAVSFMETVLMGYPVAAYRNNGNTERSPGGSGGYQKPPTPANDNVRVPQPANDNWRPFPQQPRTPPSPFGKRVPPAIRTAARFSRPLGGLVARGIPVIGTALLVYEIADWVNQQYKQWSVGPYIWYGWRLNQFCEPGRAFIGQSHNCGVTTAQFPIGEPWGNPIPYRPSISFIAFYTPLYTKNIFGEWRFRMANDWVKEVGGVPMGTRGAPQRKPRPEADKPFMPAVDPFIWPYHWPRPTPRPLPWGVAPPATAFEGDWSQRGYEFNPAPRPRPQPYHPHKPTPPREKEKKSRLRQGFAIVLKGGYAATELKDAVEALVDGVKTPWGKLPPAFPEWVLAQLPKNASIYDKMALAVKYWGELDPSQAVINLGVNGIIDLAVGVPQGKLTEFANQHGFVHGPHPFGGPINL